MRHKNKNNLKVGHILKNARIACGYTQEQVAEKINCASRYIGQLETDRSCGSINLLIDLCNLYNISLNDIYAEYLHSTNLNKENTEYSIVGYAQLNKDYRSIVDNLIQYLNYLQSNTK